MTPENAVPQLNVPVEFISVIDKTGIGNSIDEKLRAALAFGLFVEHSVTLEKASELAGMPLAGFIKLLREKKIPWMEYNAEHVKEDNFAVRKYFEGNNEK